MVLASTVWGASMLLLAVCVGGAIGLRLCRLVLRSPTATRLKWEAVGSIASQASGSPLNGALCALPLDIPASRVSTITAARLQTWPGRSTGTRT